MIKNKREHKRAALIYFPQWQGSGLTRELQIGAQTLFDYFHEGSPLRVPLSDEPLDTKYNISGYHPLLTQLKSAEDLLYKNQPEKLVLIAGDCASEIAPIDYLNSRYDGQLTVIWLDAHADLNTPESSPSGHFHGMPLRLLLDGGFDGVPLRTSMRVKSQQVILAGLRDPDAPEQVYIIQNSISVLNGMLGWKQKLLDLVAEKISTYVYIHLDLDVLDPASFPCVKCPTPAGFDSKELNACLNQILDNYCVVGMALTETTARTQEELEPIKDILDTYKRYIDGAYAN
ncbi:arginase family protein [Dyadobacter sp. 3J3]|uniref:arginase family protein n=1 Tax=Dyadobacter sp. 3J3 TaxID=2606600 RepID=UPI00135ADCF1|nr:arginase family protein [Dyadobacter sp. 3J3]